MVFYTVPPRKLLAGMVWIILLLQVSTTAFAQKVTINERNKPLTDIFKEIRKQSGLDFVYNVKAVKKIGNVSVNKTNADVSTVLGSCLSGSNLSFEINNKGIIKKEAVKKQEEKPKETPPVN